MSKIKNKNFTKKDISKKINLKIGISNAYASKITDDFINVLKNLIKNNETNIKNFATFRIIKGNLMHQIKNNLSHLDVKD